MISYVVRQAIRCVVSLKVLKPRVTGERVESIIASHQHLSDLSDLSPSFFIQPSLLPGVSDSRNAERVSSLPNLHDEEKQTTPVHVRVHVRRVYSRLYFYR